MDTWLRIEAGQLDRAAVLAADLSELAERPASTFGGRATLQASSAPWPHSAPTTSTRPSSTAHIATMATLLDTLRTLEVNMYRAFSTPSSGGC